MAIATKTKTPTHYKKRVGKHHKASKHYMKAYWPYLPLAGIVAIGMVANTLLFGPGKVLGDQTSITVNGLFTDTNQQRSTDGETTLELNSQLTSAAQAKADDMVSRDYWSHNTPDGKQPWSFITTAGYTYHMAGENLAYGFDNSDSVLTGWMNSPEHKANILNNGYRDVGFGIASSPNFVGTGPETIVVAMYGDQQEPAVANISFTVGGTKPAENPVSTQQPADEQQASTPTNTQTSGTVAAQAHSPKALSTTRNVSRLELLSGSGATLSAFALTALFAAMLTIFLVRHIRFWHRTIRKGEAFVVCHVWLDALVITIATTVYIVSRAAGVIG